jgi:hypothetical protein
MSWSGNWFEGPRGTSPIGTSPAISHSMKATVAHRFCLSAAFLASTSLGRAHPGHEGDELTWDFSHLAAHPAASFGWVAVLIGIVWGTCFLVRRAVRTRSGFQPGQIVK